MATYIVAYDLHQQGQNYSCLTKKLDAYPIHWHMQGSVWIIETSQSAVAIRDNLASCLDQNDKLFVGLLAGESAWRGYSDAIGSWLKDRLENFN